jgi:hypothetical protein
MKTIISILGLTSFKYNVDFKTRTEIEYYSDGTNAIAEAIYYKTIIN